jgi:hypothetical protein
MYGRNLPPDHEPPGLPYVKQVTVTGLVVLFIIVAWFALTAEKPSPVDQRPVPTSEQQGISEQRITLSDGRVLMCLTFPGASASVSCDWSRAFR